MLDNLFENIGAKIKNWAKWMFIVEAIVAVITGTALLVSHDDALVLAGLLTLFCGPIIALVSSWLLYGFGEIIVKLTAIEHNTCSANTGNEDVCVYSDGANEQQVHILTDDEIARKQKIARIAELRKKGLITEEMYQKAINNPKILEKF